MAAILAALTHPAHGVIDSIEAIGAVGHRVVHGGERLTHPLAVDEGDKAYLGECCRFAPLHNPHHLKGIEACERRIPKAAQVAVFDTAFHATIPRHAFLYGIPLRFYTEDHIRRYGFHGISHKYVSESAARHLQLSADGLRMITCHLGNGCSMTAVKDGRSVDTSMGFTPLEGLVMGTRCGDIDPAAVLHLMEHHRFSPASMNDLLNKQSGLLALAGIDHPDRRRCRQIPGKEREKLRSEAGGEAARLFSSAADEACVVGCGVARSLIAALSIDGSGGLSPGFGFRP